MKKYVLILTIMTLIVFSCSKKAIIRNYYVVQLPESAENQELKAEKSFLVTVDVRDFQVAKAFEQTRIALRTASNELNYFYYHHWAVRPSYALADQAQQILDRMDLFQRVNRGFSYSPNYLVTGIVHNIERYQVNKQQSAHLALTFQLIDVKTSLPVVRHEFDRIEKLEKSKSMNAFAALTSEIFYQETVIFAQKISDYLLLLEQ